MAYKKTYNPCDDCLHSYSLNNQESDMCKICEFRQLLANPTADVVEVVRCKDCRHGSKCTDGYYTCRVDHRLAHDEDDFCSCGEKETEGGGADNERKARKKEKADSKRTVQ